MLLISFCDIRIKRSPDRMKSFTRSLCILVNLIVIPTVMGHPVLYNDQCELITYGDKISYLPPLCIEVQRPVIPISRSKESVQREPGGATYDYSVCLSPASEHPVKLNPNLPVTIQRPLHPHPRANEERAPDLLTGRTYGFDVQMPQRPSGPILRHYTTARQEIIRKPEAPRKGAVLKIVCEPEEPAKVQKADLSTIVEYPQQRQSHSEYPGEWQPPKKLTGLTTKVDKCLIPITDLEPASQPRPSLPLICQSFDAVPCV